MAVGYRRRNFIINKPFQMKMLVGALLITIPELILYYFSFYFFIHDLRERLEFMDQRLVGSLVEFVNSAEDKMTAVVVLGSLLIIATNLVVFILLSHAIAGPIEKLKGHLTKKAEGVATGPFHIRKGDYFTELPDYVNRAFKDETSAKT